MPLNTIIRDQAKPWLNARVNDLRIDGSLRNGADLGQSGFVLTSNGASQDWEAKIQKAYFAQVENANADGGALAAGTWTARAINTELSNQYNIASLVGNAIQPIAGEYTVKASASAFGTDGCQLRLRNITSGSVVGVGLTGFSADAGNVQCTLTLEVDFSTNGTDQYVLEQFAEVAPAVPSEAGGTGHAGAIPHTFVLLSVLKRL